LKFTLIDVRNFWDSVADIYEKENAKVGAIHNQRFIEAVKHLSLSKEKSLLNIWSRDGGAIPFLRQLNTDFKLINAELSAKMLAIGWKKYPEEEFLQCSLHNFPFVSEKFDYVLSLETLEHVPQPERFLKEINRVLKKGGKLVLSLPPARAEWLLRIYGLFFGGHGEGPHRFLASKEVKKLINDSGLRLILHKPTVYFPLCKNIFSRLNEFLESKVKNSFLQEFAIRQFYLCEKD